MPSSDETPNVVGAEESPTTNPSMHCFRENGCAAHEGVPESDLCCCCGYPPEAHTGCDCESADDSIPSAEIVVFVSGASWEQVDALAETIASIVFDETRPYPAAMSFFQSGSSKEVDGR